MHRRDDRVSAGRPLRAAAACTAAALVVGRAKERVRGAVRGQPRPARERGSVVRHRGFVRVSGFLPASRRRGARRVGRRPGRPRRRGRRPRAVTAKRRPLHSSRRRLAPPPATGRSGIASRARARERTARRRPTRARPRGIDTRGPGPIAARLKCMPARISPPNSTSSKTSPSSSSPSIAGGIGRTMVRLGCGARGRSSDAARDGRDRPSTSPSPPDEEDADGDARDGARAEDDDDARAPPPRPMMTRDVSSAEEKAAHARADMRRHAPRASECDGAGTGWDARAPTATGARAASATIRFSAPPRSY